MEGGQFVVRHIMNTFHKLDIHFLGTDIRAAAPGLLIGDRGGGRGGDALSFISLLFCSPGSLGLEGTPHCDRDCGPVRVPDVPYPDVIDLERRQTPRL